MFFVNMLGVLHLGGLMLDRASKFGLRYKLIHIRPGAEMRRKWSAFLNAA